MRDFFITVSISALQKSLLYFSHDSADSGTLIPPFFLGAFHTVLYLLTMRTWNPCCERWGVISDSHLKAQVKNNLVAQRAPSSCSADLYSIPVACCRLSRDVYFPPHGRLGVLVRTSQPLRFLDAACSKNKGHVTVTSEDFFSLML